MNRTFFSTFLTKSIALFLLGIISFFLAGCDKHHSHHSDSKMIADFQTHKAAFARLIELLKEDKTITWISKPSILGQSFGYRFFPSKEGLSDERYNEYLAILNKIKPNYISIQRGRTTGELNKVSLQTSESEYKYDSYKTQSEKSYVWMPLTTCPEENIDPGRKYILKEGEKQIFLAPCDVPRPASLILNDNLDKYNQYRNMDSTQYRDIQDNWYLSISTDSNESSGE